MHLINDVPGFEAKTILIQELLLINIVHGRVINPMQVTYMHTYVLFQL